MASRNWKAWSFLRKIKLVSIAIGLLLSTTVLVPLLGASGGGLEIKVKVRTVEQIAAFYEARGFPATALGKIANHCFIGVTVKNGTSEVVWLETGRWRIVPVTASASASAPLQPGYWYRVWQEIGLEKARQATFRWTQLPSERDLQPQEPVGGNIAIPRRGGVFRLDLVFATGQDRQGAEIRRQFAGLRCK